MQICLRGVDNMNPKTILILVGLVTLVVVIISLPVVLVAHEFKECDCSLNGSTPYPNKEVLRSRCVEICNCTEALSTLR